MAKYGMAIDLAKCVGCGACAIACKTENNTQHQIEGGKSSFNWCDYVNLTSGTFPNVYYRILPVQCNHCTNAPCVAGCLAPVDGNGNRALYKTATGITMRDETRCIGCRECMVNCPYSSDDISTSGKQFSVNSFNEWSETPQPLWANTTAIISGGTSTPNELATAAANIPPTKHDYTHPYYSAVRPEGVAEKCYFCEHRLLDGETTTYCQASCPTGARVFGDLNDSNSEISLLLTASGYKRLKNNDGEYLSLGDNGTDPNVFYLNDFSYLTETPKVVENKVKKLKIYPNPAKESTNIEFDLSETSTVSLSIFDITGKEVKQYSDNNIYTNGIGKIYVNVNDLKAGTYICVLKSQNETMAANLLITK